MKTIKKLIMFIFLCCLFTGCSFGSKQTMITCKVWSVDSSDACSHYVCSNNQGTYIYQTQKGVSGIYNLDTQELVIKFADNESFHCMAATDEYLFYHKQENYGTLCVFSFEKQEEIVKLDHMDICGIKTNGEDVFIAVKDNEVGRVKVGMYVDNQLLWMQDVLYDDMVEKQDDEKVYYLYDGYTIVTEKNESSVVVEYIKKQDFLFSCSSTKVYIDLGDNVCSLEKQPDFIPKTTGAFGGLSKDLMAERNGSIYFITQYSKREYKENPSNDFYVKSQFCKYDIQNNKLEILYEGNGDEQIVGFSIDTFDVFVMSDQELFKDNVKNSGRQVLLQNRFKDEEKGAYYFENTDDGIIVLSQKLYPHESEVKYEGYIKY